MSYYILDIFDVISYQDPTGSAKNTMKEQFTSDTKIYLNEKLKSGKKISVASQGLETPQLVSWMQTLKMT